jgi:dihydroorotate dehydrogenase electron transfer subunit
VTATLARTQRAAAESVLVTLEVGPGFPPARPGQFVSVVASREQTLRRPFSIAGVPRAGAIDLLIEARGKGTREIASLEEGASLDVMGPLGNAFTLSGTDETLLVAGGIGVAGLRYLAEEIGRAGRTATMLVGARSRDRLLHHLLPSVDGHPEARVATDDGTAGFAGTVCDLFEREAPSLERGTRIYCCGPRSMLERVAGLALARDFRCEVLLEEVMACGVGACRGCVVGTVHGYRAVCSDGPVFDARDIVWEDGHVG